MLIDINKDIKRKTIVNKKVPEYVLKTKNKSLPGDLFYESDKHGNLIIRSKDKYDVSMNVVMDANDPELREILKNKPTYEELYKYIINSQTPLKINTEESGKMLINGFEIDPKKYFYNYWDEKKEVGREGYIIPPKFQKCNDLIFKFEDNEYRISIERIPNKSIYIEKYRSFNNPIVFNMTIDTKNGSIQYSISYDLTLAKNATEAYNCLILFNNIMDGNVTLFDFPIESKENYKINNRYMEVWKKLSVIEKNIKKEFVPRNGAITVEEMSWIELLYRYFTDSKPLRTNQSINSVKSSTDIYQQYFDNYLAIEYLSKETYELFGQTVTAFIMKINYNCHIGKTTKEKDVYITEIDNNDNNRKQYTSSKLFLKKKDLDKYKKDHPNYINEMVDSTYLE